MKPVRVLLLPLVVATLLTGCGGQACDELPALQAERDVAREQQVERTGPGSTLSEDEKGDADDRLHELEGRVFRLEQECENR